ncbi:response regulator [bacterium]|nr:response regulator [bacterium]
MTKILLVEDNPMNRDMLSRRLVRRGFEVVCSEDGESVLGILETENPKLILMDISLPGIDGLETTRRVRSDARFKSLPIIALTAHAFQSDELAARAAGCDEYETKPIELERLIEKMGELLKKNAS